MLHSKREGIEKPQERESTWFAEDAILWSSALRKLGVSAMVAGGEARDRFIAWMGHCCYTIDAERAQAVRKGIGPDALETRDGKTYFDLWSAIAAQLRAAGVRQVEVARICTLSGGADLWSYRGRGPDGKYGTQLGFIGSPRLKAAAP